MVGEVALGFGRLPHQLGHNLDAPVLLDHVRKGYKLVLPRLRISEDHWFIMKKYRWISVSHIKVKLISKKDNKEKW